MKRVGLWISAVAVMWLLVGSAVLALDVPPAPILDRPIVDRTDTLTTEDVDALAREIATLRQEKDFQIGILMIPSLDGQVLEEYALQVAREWGVGNAQTDSGVLLLIVKDDRKIRIEIGSGQEGDLTDVRAARIIRNAIAPKFRDEDWVGGIRAGVTDIAAAIQGKPDMSADSANSGTGAGMVELGIFLLVIGATIVDWLASIFARSKSWWAGGVVGAAIGGVVVWFAAAALWSLAVLGFLAIGGLVLDYVVSKNYKTRRRRGISPAWWAGGDWFGGGRSGGSSGGRFGGGGFGGGGASGGW